MDSEVGIFVMIFDLSSSWFIICEVDKIVKIYKEDDIVVSIIIFILSEIIVWNGVFI